MPVIKAGALHRLAKLLQSKNTKNKIRACTTISNLALGKHQQALINEGPIMQILQMVKSYDSKLRFIAIIAITNALAKANVEMTIALLYHLCFTKTRTCGGRIDDQNEKECLYGSEKIIRNGKITNQHRFEKLYVELDGRMIMKNMILKEDRDINLLAHVILKGLPSLYPGSHKRKAVLIDLAEKLKKVPQEINDVNEILMEKLGFYKRNITILADYEGYKKPYKEIIRHNQPIL
ncbi:hypothetical protein OROGR_015006 [Orobanche gracilis]